MKTTVVCSNGPQVFLRASTREKKVIIDAGGGDFFHGFHLSATFIADFIKSLDKPFVVDPVLYQFVWAVKGVKDEKKGGIKPSIKRLAEKYGGPVQQHVGKRPLKPDDFNSDWQAVENMIASIMDYQKNVFNTGQLDLCSTYYDKYDGINEEESEPPTPCAGPEPCILIAPYLPFNKIGDPWYDITLKMAYSASQYVNSAIPLYPVLLIPPEILDDGDAIKRICDDYLAGDFGGYFIWINKTSENSADENKLSGLISMVRCLASGGKPVYKLFGGYFSCLLFADGLKGFSCGLGYGESKNVFAYGGGPGSGQPRYYIPRLHRALELGDAERLIRAYPSLACDCVMCKDVYGDNIMRFSEMKEPGRCQRHFINVRKKEMTRIASRGITTEIGEINSTIKEFKGNELIDTGSLSNWAKLLSPE